MQADRGNGSVPRVGDQRGHHELAALLGQEPRSSQGHWGYCQETQGKAWPRKPTQSSETREDSGQQRHVGLGLGLGWGGQLQQMTRVARAQGRQSYAPLGSMGTRI